MLKHVRPDWGHFDQLCVDFDQVWVVSVRFRSLWLSKFGHQCGPISTKSGLSSTQFGALSTMSGLISAPGLLWPSESQFRPMCWADFDTSYGLTPGPEIDGEHLDTHSLG